ncbi:hypothetical protein CDN99_06665 [Roseateles aquatilis]|uniref:Uncharacterized protein n=1 Tax=Roseateles aquatilis TaxID=431061 RepID=A0A246JHJ0_9BURK|nr:hypothetical protein [Roseateles aquatilis]OWQ92035.1 hypothetical protein CDN99_06665 [Roseateles aquatilis]
MLDDLFEAQTLTNLRDEALRPPPVPRQAASFSAWRTSTAAPRGVAAGAAQSSAFLSDVVGAFGQVLDATGTVSARGMFATQSEEERKNSQAAAERMRQGLDFSSEAGDLFRGVAQGYAPDATTAHASERLVFDFARVGTKAAGYIAAGGPIVGGVLTAGDEGLTVSDELKQQGVDLGTRTAVGAVVGAVTGLGVALPMAGQTARQTIGLVAAGGPGAFVAQQAGVRAILQAADYSHLAEQYDPFDPVGLAVSTFIPGAFGAHGLRVNRRAAAARAAEDFRTGPVPSDETPTAAAAREAAGRPSDEVADAARVLLQRDQRDSANPFRPDDWRAYAAHEQAFARAIDQIASGQPVRVNDVIVPPELGPARQLLEQIDALQTERADLLPMAADLAEPGAIRDARAELGQLRARPPDTSDAGAKALAKQIQEQQGVSYKAALTEARKQLQGQQADFDARVQRIEAAIDRNAKAQQATQRIGEIDQRVSALEQQLGPESRLAQFQRDLEAGVRQLEQQPAARVPVRKETPPDASAPAAPPSRPTEPAQPKAADAGGAGAEPPLPPDVPGEGPRSAAPKAGLVDDAAAARVAQIELEQPGLLVQLDGMDAPRPLSEVMTAVKAEADELLSEAELYQTAAQCALLNRW